MAFIPSRRKQHRSDSGEARLQLTSMMDMFTIILVFLLKTYSTQGQLINPSEDLTLPSSISENQAEQGLDVTVSADWILVNGKPVTRTENAVQAEGFLIPELQDALLRYADEGEKMETTYGAKFSGRVTIQGDKNLPYSSLIKVLATCGQSKYPNMRLVIYQKEG